MTHSTRPHTSHLPDTRHIERYSVEQQKGNGQLFPNECIVLTDTQVRHQLEAAGHLRLCVFLVFLIRIYLHTPRLPIRHGSELTHRMLATLEPSRTAKQESMRFVVARAFATKKPLLQKGQLFHNFLRTLRVRRARIHRRGGHDMASRCSAACSLQRGLKSEEVVDVARTLTCRWGIWNWCL